MLPDLQEGDVLKLLSFEPRQHFTLQPPRFTQATLIRELEEEGIGRPSTYAGIVSNILVKEYIVLDERRYLNPTELGMLVLGIRCPPCVEGNLREKKSRRGKIFFGCDRYPLCRFAAWDRPVAEACFKCGVAILPEKVTKRAGRVRHCHKDECDYTVQVVE